MQTELPAPEFKLGDSVRVVVGERNFTAHVGIISQVVWHHKDGCYNYYLESESKKISKRYTAKDLLLTSSTSFKPTPSGAA